MDTLTTTFYRNKIKESVHNTKCIISSINEEIIYSTNNENDYIYPRSSIKIFQAIPFVLSNAIKFYNLNTKQIALSCSSHNGEKFHIKELKDWLKKVDIKKNYLKCGIHNPLDKASSEKLLLLRDKPNQIHNNCAGKHLAMLSSCKINKYNFDDYVDLNHPHQKQIRKVFSEFTEGKIFKFQYGIDGCSAPQYAFKIKELLYALKNILRSLNGRFNYKKEISLLINSITKNPKYIGGSNNLDSNLIRITKGEMFCKGGAEGVFLFAHIKKGLCGVLKVEDGNERALPSAIFELFKKFNILNKIQQKEYLTYYEPNLYNHAKIKIGSTKTELS
jgi:L-asparaginase II